MKQFKKGFKISGDESGAAHLLLDPFRDLTSAGRELSLIRGVTNPSLFFRVLTVIHRPRR